MLSSSRTWLVADERRFTEEDELILDLSWSWTDGEMATAAGDDGSGGGLRGDVVAVRSLYFSERPRSLSCHPEHSVHSHEPLGTSPRPTQYVWKPRSHRSQNIILSSSLIRNFLININSTILKLLIFKDYYMRLLYYKYYFPKKCLIILYATKLINF